jgi:hypothetical protein
MSRLVARGAVTVMPGLDHLGVDVARPGDTGVPRTPQDYRGRRRNSLFFGNELANPTWPDAGF